MNKTFPIILAGVLLAASTTALARDHGRDRREPPRDGNVAMEMVGHMHHALKQLDLSAEQKSAIRTEFKGMRDEMEPLVGALHENRAELHGLLTAADYDAASVSSVADEQGRITADMIRLASATIHSAMDQLTDAQRARLAELRDERRERLEKKLGHMQQRLERMDGAD